MLLETILSQAKESIRILTGTLDEGLYAQETIIERANEFLACESRTLQIVFEDTALRHENERRRHPFLRAITHSERVQLRFAPPELQTMYPFHYMVADRSTYRFEPSKTSPRAIYAFGDERIGNDLDKLFSKLWSKSIAVQPPLRARR